ncbi:hypothetical protein BURPSPAST_Z0536 [Burkholderia pseudomallei Pasteur 52237]|nr:hypothetical protein BURPSPAST_Z0536 [Burkholderia pseudomallei Pasteur 52237]
MPDRAQAARDPVVGCVCAQDCSGTKTRRGREAPLAHAESTAEKRTIGWRRKTRVQIENRG